MFCPVCGLEVTDDAKFCPRCGTMLDSANQPDEDPALREFRRQKEEFENQGKQKIRCPACGEYVSVDDSICRNCGSKLIIPGFTDVSSDFNKISLPNSAGRPYFGDDDFNKRPAAKRSSGIAGRLIIFIILLIVIAAVIWFLRR